MTATEIRHGTRGAYIHQHCHCPACTTANTHYTNRQRKTPEGRGAVRARRRALTRLAAAHHAEYLTLLTEERHREGLA